MTDNRRHAHLSERETAQVIDGLAHVTNDINLLIANRTLVASQIIQHLHDPEQVANHFNQVIVALATLQSSVQDLSRAYINHANTVLAPGRGGELNSNLTNILTESGLLAGSATQMPVVVDAAPEAEGKKKRKRVPHDPNAPKRALTPYFLYMQSARTQIAKELGDNAKPKEVADEGTRRWTEMAPAEKHVWDELYQKNLAVYRVRMAAYKAGQPVPEDAEAVRLVEAGKAPAIIAELQSEEEVEEPEPAEEEDDSTPEPVKEPSPPKSKRRKSEKVASPVAKETPKSVTKAAAAKSKKAAAAKKEASPVPEPASTSKPAEKKKRGKKA